MEHIEQHQAPSDTGLIITMVVLVVIIMVTAFYFTFVRNKKANEQTAAKH